MSPALLVLGVFGIFPIGYAFFVSLHRWRIKKESVVGLRHYVKALGDPVWLLSLVLGVGLLVLARSIATRGGIRYRVGARAAPLRARAARNRVGSRPWPSTVIVSPRSCDSCSRRSARTPSVRD